MEITPKLIVKCKGGIGNQLFQIFFAISQSMKHGIEYGIDIDGCIQFAFYLFFFVKLSSATSLENPILYLEKRENVLDASNQINNVPIVFDGYFQDYRYFHAYTDEIRSMLQIDWLRENMANRVSSKMDISLENADYDTYSSRGLYIATLFSSFTTEGLL